MFVWGANTHGSLGLGHKTDRAVPTLLPLTAEGMLPGATSRCSVNLACGMDSTLVCCQQPSSSQQHLPMALMAASSSSGGGVGGGDWSGSAALSPTSPPATPGSPIIPGDMGDMAASSLPTGGGGWGGRGSVGSAGSAGSAGGYVVVQGGGPTSAHGGKGSGLTVGGGGGDLIAAASPGSQRVANVGERLAQKRLASLLSRWKEKVIPRWQELVDATGGQRGANGLIPRQGWVVSLWRQGIPLELRGTVWPLAIGNALR